MIYNARITQIGNSKGVRLPKELVLSLGTKEVIIEQTKEGILIKPKPEKPLWPPLNEWKFENVEHEPEFDDWDCTLMDGLTEDGGDYA